MPSSRQKESLYKDRIFGDDETPPRPAPAKPENAMTDEHLPWFTNIDKPKSGSESAKEAYPLNRDALASTRLNLQHHLFASSNGFLIHPDIPLKADLMIADIGCGTGIWSLEMSKKLPSGGKIEASDISLAQAPPEGWWPSNVTFEERDIFAPIPYHLQGRYDIVNIRLFMCVVQNGDPMPLLGKLMKLLKPGGYLQWQEYDSDKVILADPSMSAPRLDAIVNFFRKAHSSTGDNLAWIKSMHSRFGEAGGELVAHERHWTSREAILIKQDTMFLAIREVAANLRAKDPSSDAAKQQEKLCDEIEAECWALGRGSCIDNEMVTWVVRKDRSPF